MKRLLIPVVLMVLLVTGCGTVAERSDAADVAAGVAYLEELEAGDPQEVVDAIQQLHRERLEALRDQRILELEEDPSSVWAMFEDYVILGDSRAVGFSTYSFLPESNVLAEVGAGISNLKEHIPDLISLSPTSVFLCYGLNDIGNYATAEDYAQGYGEVIAQIQEALPNATIYISSILPVRDPAYSKKALWRTVPDCNLALQTLCEENGYVYVDNDEIAETYSGLWEPDGIHVQRGFYRYWAANLMIEMYSTQLGL